MPMNVNPICSRILYPLVSDLGLMSHLFWACPLRPIVAWGSGSSSGSGRKPVPTLLHLHTGGRTLTCAGGHL